MSATCCCCCIVSLCLVSVSTVACLSPSGHPSPPLATSRTIPSQTTPSTRSTDQLSRLCHPINRLRPPQTAPATITSHPSQHFCLPKQNRPWVYIDSAGWLLSVRSAKGYTFHTSQPLNLLLLLSPASPTIHPPHSGTVHTYDICQPTLCPQHSFPHTLLALPASPSQSLPLSRNNCTDRRLLPLNNTHLPPALHLTPTHLFVTSLQFFALYPRPVHIYLPCLALPRLASPRLYTTWPLFPG